MASRCPHTNDSMNWWMNHFFSWTFVFIFCPDVSTGSSTLDLSTDRSARSIVFSDNTDGMECRKGCEYYSATITLIWRLRFDRIVIIVCNIRRVKFACPRVKTIVIVVSRVDFPADDCFRPYFDGTHYIRTVFRTACQYRVSGQFENDDRCDRPKLKRDKANRSSPTGRGRSPTIIRTFFNYCV